MIATLFSMLKAINTSEFKLCFSQSPLTTLQALITVKSGAKSFDGVSDGLINMFVTKCDCHASSVIQVDIKLKKKKIKKFE